ncbi:MAG: acyl-CoA dehydratase activase-related protein [Candidatus Heimdallarchaeota archaeon]
MPMIRVGIPRALIYYKFFPMWEAFFKRLGAEVVISPITDRTIREKAISAAPDEDCYSTKIFFGHVLEIKDDVDFLFIPRFGSKHKTDMGCPKFIGLADVLRSMFPDLPPIIMPHYNIAKGRDNKLTFFLKSLKVGLIFTKNPFRLISAFIKAMKAYKQHKKDLIIDLETLAEWETRNDFHLNDKPKMIPGERPLKIALVGHSYVINDNYCSLNIRKKLKNFGVQVITSEQIPRSIIDQQLSILDNRLYFEFEREILGSIMYFLEQESVDGIIHLMIFGCGPDSLAGDLAMRFSKRMPNIQLLQLVLDDLTAEAGLNTRLEAFIDMLRRRKEKVAVHIPVLRVP